MPQIVTLTINPTVDKSTNVETVASEIKMRCDEPQFDPGGGGINVSRAIHKLGGDSLAIFTSGGGPGQMLAHLLDVEGVPVRPVQISAMTRENLIVYENSSGLQYRFGMPGPMVTEWRACLEITMQEEPEYLVASGSLPPGVPDDFYGQLAQRAADQNIRMIVDTSGVALEACAKAGVFLLKPNLRELEMLSGQTFESEEQLIAIARDLIADGMAEVFVISMGASGAMLVSDDLAVKMRPPVVPIKSKVGAGDSMVGGLVWSLARGDDLQTAVRYGIAAGSAAVMTPGTELCRREDVLDIFERIAILD